MNKIMIVEDEMIIAREIEEQLKKLNYEVIGIATSGDEALKFLNENRPDLILMDIVIQGEKDGIEVAEEINKKYGIPIVFVSANTDESIVERAKRTMPCGFVVKPFTDRELLLNIEIALYKYEADERIKKIEFWYANHDSLTKLYNRHFLDRYFETLIEDGTHEKDPFCVMLIDIDNFKAINDEYGHLIGDTLLQKVSLFFEENFREEDKIFRYGGDEFLFVLHGVDLTTTTQLAETLLKRVQNFAFVCGKEELYVQLSIGIAAYPNDGKTLDSLIKASDEALYHAKKNGKNRVSLSFTSKN